MPSHITVLIVGAGPAGLNLACLLAQYQIPFRIIEQKTEPLLTSNALAVQPRSLEMWDSMGVVDKAIAQGKKIEGLCLNDATSRLATLRFADADLTTPFPFILGLSQAETEQLLADALTNQGYRVERGISLSDFTQTNEQVTATLQATAGEQERVTCDWLIAADGCHSAMRKKLNLPFTGTVIPEQFIMADVTLKADLDPDYGHVYSASAGPLAFLPMKNFTRIICSVTGDVGIKDFLHPTPADFAYVIRERSPIPMELENFIWTTHFVAQQRMIDQYRHGRVIFVGDSAHIHSPVGGQGMNMGMQDGFNLAWKLAYVIKHNSAVTLLDSYQSERHPIAKKVLLGTTFMTRFVTWKNPYLLGLRNLFIKFMFKRKFFYRRFLAAVTELSVAYLTSPIVLRSSASTCKIKAGQRALPIPLTISPQNPLKQLLLLFSGKNNSNAKADEIIQLHQWVQAAAADFFEVMVISPNNLYFSDILVYLDQDASVHDKYDMSLGGMVVIRPDQYVGLVTEEISVGRMEDYLQKVL